MTLVEYLYLLLAGAAWWSVFSAFCAMSPGKLSILRRSKDGLVRFSSSIGITPKVKCGLTTIMPH